MKHSGTSVVNLPVGDTSGICYIYRKKKIIYKCKNNYIRFKIRVCYFCNTIYCISITCQLCKRFSYFLKLYILHVFMCNKHKYYIYKY